MHETAQAGELDGYDGLVDEITEQYPRRVFWFIGGGCFIASVLLLLFIQYFAREQIAELGGRYNSDVVIVGLSLIGGVINAAMGILSAWMAKDMMVKYLLVQGRLRGDMKAYRENTGKRLKLERERELAEESLERAEESLEQAQEPLEDDSEAVPEDRLKVLAKAAATKLSCVECGVGLYSAEIEPIENDYLMCVVKCPGCEAELLLDTLQKQIVESA